MGILDQFSQEGLLGGAGAFLQGPSMTPQSTSGNFGRGLLGYQQAAGQAQDRQMRSLLGLAQIQHMGAQNELIQQQVAQRKQDMELMKQLSTMQNDPRLQF